MRSRSWCAKCLRTIKDVIYLQPNNSCRHAPNTSQSSFISFGNLCAMRNKIQMAGYSSSHATRHQWTLTTWLKVWQESNMKIIVVLFKVGETEQRNYTITHTSKELWIDELQKCEEESKCMWQSLTYWTWFQCGIKVWEVMRMTLSSRTRSVLEFNIFICLINTITSFTHQSIDGPECETIRHSLLCVTYHSHRITVKSSRWTSGVDTDYSKYMRF